MVVAVDAVNMNAVPFNSAAEARLIAATRITGGSSAAPRPGRVPGPATAGVVTVLSSPFRWSITPAAYVLLDGVGGVYEVIWTTAKSENFPTAPGAGTSRVDWLMLEAVDTTSPSVHTAQLKLYSGTASSGTPPDPTGYPATALKLGSFATPASGAPVWTPAVVQRTGLVGSVIQVATPAELAALTAVDGMAAYQEDVDIFLGRANGVWRGFGGQPLFNGVLNTLINTVVGAAAWTTEASGLVATFTPPTPNVRVTWSTFLTGTGNETRCGYKISGGLTRDPTADEAGILVVASGSGSTESRPFLLTGLTPGTSYTLSSAVYNSLATTVTANYRRLLVEAA
ncbi:MAG: hypothetical protein JWQ74_437 [Marmoricola sp.]|nr:hypothetical protein [Marmoricola sp.]